jgi:putative endonuclease
MVIPGLDQGLVPRMSGLSDDVHSFRVLAGLVPAIHAGQTTTMRSGYVYIVTNRPNGTLYLGVTSNLNHRIWQHRSKAIEGFAKHYGLGRLVWYESFDDIRNAIQKERNMKHWPRAWKIRLILDLNPDWRDLYDELNA